MGVCGDGSALWTVLGCRIAKKFWEFRLGSPKVFGGDLYWLRYDKLTIGFNKYVMLKEQEMQIVSIGQWQRMPQNTPPKAAKC